MPAPATRAVHAGTQDASGAVHPAVQFSATFRYPELPDGSPAPYIYARYTNPTVEAVEKAMAHLDGAKHALAFGSGMAGVAAIGSTLLHPRDVLVHQRGIYGGTTAFFQTGLATKGVKVVAGAVQEPPRLPRGTRLVWVESITNPLLRVADIRAWADAAHDASAILAVDATFASPILQNPLDMGADLVLHSGTKYLGGHSDLLAGLVTTNDASLAEALRLTRRNTGSILDPHASFLLARGMKTVALRVERHSANATELARRLSETSGGRASAGPSRRSALNVVYPGLAKHPDHAVAGRVLRGGYGGMLSIDLGSLAAARRFRRALNLILPAASLGAVESLASLPLETSHQYAPAEQRRKEGVTDGLVRISVGIEDVDDLWADLQTALASAKRA